MDTDYSLADLARMADVTPRTIRYYLAQGLLPSPEAAGPATRYSEGHLARLRLIRRLQRDHLPLAEIRERLELMNDDEVVEALAATGAVGTSEIITDRSETAGYVHRLMEQARIEPNVYPAAAMPVQDEHFANRAPSSTPRPRLASQVSRRMVFPAEGPPAATPPEDRTPSRLTRSTWERLVITPDIEIHVRRPLKPLDNKRADVLERYARELFQDEP